MDPVFCETTIVVVLLLSFPNASSESVYSELTYDFPARESIREQCRPWFNYRSSSHQCHCYTNVHTKHYIECTDHGVLLKFGHCMTYSALLNETSLAGCIYFQEAGYNVTNTRAITLPDDISELKSTCVGR